MSQPVPSPDSPVPDIAAFRAAMGRFVTGITVVTACVDGVDHAMTANSLTSVSLEPMLLAVCVEATTRFHEAIMSATGWALSILPGDAADVAAWLATRGRPLRGQLQRVAHHPGPVTGAALIDDALASVECLPWAAYPGGDHTIVVGSVAAVSLAPQPGDPLVYHERRYLTLRDVVAERQATR